MYLRIGLLQKELLAPLLWGYWSRDIGGEIGPDRHSLSVGQVGDILANRSLKPYPKSRNSKVIELQFLSLPALNKLKASNPFPTRIGFGSLLRRWNAFLP